MKAKSHTHKDAAEWINSLPGFTVPHVQFGKSYKVNIANRKEKQAITDFLASNHKGENVTVFLHSNGKDTNYGDWEFSFVMHYQTNNGRIPGTTPVHLKWRKDKLVKA